MKNVQMTFQVVATSPAGVETAYGDPFDIYDNAFQHAKSLVKEIPRSHQMRIKIIQTKAKTDRLRRFKMSALGSRLSAIDGNKKMAAFAALGFVAFKLFT